MPKRTGISVKCPHCDGTGRLDLERATVGDMILARRKACKLTQEDLSKKMLLSRAQIANIEGGRSDIPTKTLQRFAEAFGCSARDLIPG
jgi:transcriptional regulator with XRE-family HTH domain